MRILDTSAITDISEFPVKSGTLRFLQDAYKEPVAQILTGLIGSSYSASIVYVLYGVKNSGTAPFYNISKGAVFYNGEVFSVDATSFTATGSNVGLFLITATQYTDDADPVTFTDSVVRNVHTWRKMTVVQGATGGSFADFLQAFYLSFNIPAQVNITAPVLPAIPFAGNVLQVLGGYPNIELFVPAPPTSANPILTAGFANLGEIAGGTGSDFTIVFSADIGTSAYYIMGTLISQGADAAADTTVVWTARGKSNTQFVIHVREFGGASQNLGLDYIIFRH